MNQKNFRLFALGIALICFVTSGRVAQSADDVEAKYTKSCKVCHESGVANAPKTGDVSVWELRTAKGMKALLVSVNKGLNAMPPKGMCYDCTDSDYKALIVYMMSPK